MAWGFHRPGPGDRFFARTPAGALANQGAEFFCATTSIAFVGEGGGTPTKRTWLHIAFTVVLGPPPFGGRVAGRSVFPPMDPL